MIGYSRKSRENFPRECFDKKKRPGLKFNRGLALIGVRTTGPWTRTWATLVWGECSHHCAILAPLSFLIWGNFGYIGCEDTLGTRGFSRVRREFSVLAEGRSHERRSRDKKHFCFQPAFRAGHYKDLTETGNRAREVSGRVMWRRLRNEKPCKFSVSYNVKLHDKYCGLSSDPPLKSYLESYHAWKRKGKKATKCPKKVFCHKAYNLVPSSNSNVRTGSSKTEY